MKLSKATSLIAGLALIAAPVAISAPAAFAADYTFDCLAPEGGDDARDVQSIEIQPEQVYTVEVKNCSWAYTKGADGLQIDSSVISPSYYGDHFLSPSETFTISGPGELNAYVPGVYGMDWTFTAPTTGGTDPGVTPTDNPSDYPIAYDTKSSGSLAETGFDSLPLILAALALLGASVVMFRVAKTKK